MAVLWWFRIIEAVGKQICWATCAYQPPLSLDACAWDGCVDVGEDGQGWVVARKRDEGGRAFLGPSILRTRQITTSF